MDIGELDVKILLVSGVSLLLISSVAGSTALAGSGIGTMPQYETKAELNIGAIPDTPGTNLHSQGELIWTANQYRETQEHDPSSWIINNDKIIVSVDLDGESGNKTNVGLSVVPDGGAFNGNNVTIKPGEEVSLTTNETTVHFQYVNYNSTYDQSTVEWQLGDHPEYPTESSGGGGGWLEPLGVIADWISYFVQLIHYIVMLIVKPFIFATQVLISIITYVFNLTTWLFGGYTMLVTNAPGWASVFVAIPGVLLGLEFLKLMYVTIDILWIG